MSAAHGDAEAAANPLASFLDILRCPETGARLAVRGGELVRDDGRRYRVDAAGIPLFAEIAVSPDAETQRQHYNTIAAAYTANLEYPHTQEYVNYLDRAALAASGGGDLGTVVELCCGRGEALMLFDRQIRRYVGVDISENMLHAVQSLNRHPNALLLQADATNDVNMKFHTNLNRLDQTQNVTLGTAWLEYLTVHFGIVYFHNDFNLLTNAQLRDAVFAAYNVGLGNVDYGGGIHIGPVGRQYAITVDALMDKTQPCQRLWGH